MLKTLLLGVVAVVLIVAIGLFVWARSVFTQDEVRTRLAAQLSEALGQPVTIGSIGAAIYPRVTVNLGAVAIGEPARIEVETLQVGTDFRALLSRRIEHASLRLSGARIALPLPAFDVAAGGSSRESGDSPESSPVEIVSIDEIVLADVVITSGGRELRGDVEVVPEGDGLTIRRVSLEADDTTINVTGAITDFSGPTGELVVTAGALNFEELLAFVSDFAGSAGLGAAEADASTVPPAGASAAPSGLDIALSLEADSATMGDLSLQQLSGRARVTAESMALDPVSFGLFGGTYEGALVLTLGVPPAFTLNATLSDVDMAAVTAFAGSPDVLTGRLSGTIELAGSGLDADSVLESTRGTARVAITDGTVKRLGLVRTVVVATSGRSDVSLADAGGATDEPFSRLGGTLDVAGGSARTQDLRFESPDLTLDVTGDLRLDGSAIDLAGQVRLSEELSKQAGRDLARYTQQEGRVTLPVTITGSAESPQVRIDVASAAKRAITNRATEEVEGAIKRGLGGLLGR